MRSFQPCLVEQERGVGEVRVLAALDRALGHRLGRALADRLEDRAGDAFARRGRDLGPVGVAEEGAVGGAVEVLDRTAARLGFDEFDAVVLEQRFDVVADVAERLAEFLGELVRARDPFVQGAEDANAQRVGQGLRKLLGNALWGSAGLWQGRTSVSSLGWGDSWWQ